MANTNRLAAIVATRLPELDDARAMRFAAGALLVTGAV